MVSIFNILSKTKLANFYLNNILKIIYKYSLLQISNCARGDSGSKQLIEDTGTLTVDEVVLYNFHHLRWEFN